VDGGCYVETRTLRRLAAMSAPLLPADAQHEPVTGPASSTASDLLPGMETVLRVRRLQRDLRELMRHLACRTESSVWSVPADGQPAGSAAPRPAIGPYAELLAVAPEVIARDGHLLGQLYDSLEALTDLAAPASLKSIWLTRAFVWGGEDDDLPGDTRSEARWLFRWARGSAVFGVLIFFATILLLVHVDRGRRALQQFESIRAEYQAAANSLGIVRAASSAAGGAADYDCAQPAATPGALGPSAQVAGRGSQSHLCAQIADALSRMKVVRQELRIWNVISGRLAYVSPITWLAPRELSHATGLSAEDEEFTELRTMNVLAALLGFILPMLLGLLGACVYVFREIDRRIQTSTLEARESIHGTLRMLLGATLGGLLGVIWTGDQPVRVEGMLLSVSALAFFIGFSVDVVFRLVDALVRAVANKLSKPS
jgi:hypothetical protein